MSSTDQGQGQGQGQAQGQGGAQQPADPPLSSFIKPEQINAQNFPFFNAETLTKYQNGFKHLWQTINSNPAGSETHQQAMRKLQEANAKLAQQLRMHKAQQNKQNMQQQQAQLQQQQQQQMQQAQAPGNAAADQQQQNAQRPAGQGPQPQMQNQGQQQGVSASTHPLKAPDELPADIKAKVEKAELAPPPGIAPGGVEKWHAEASKRYGGALYIQRAARVAIQNFDLIIQRAQAQGAEVPQEIIAKKADCHRQLNDSDGFIHRLAGLQKQAGYQRTVYDDLAGSTQLPNVNGAAQQPRPGPNATAANNPAIAAAQQQQQQKQQQHQLQQNRPSSSNSLPNQAATPTSQQGFNTQRPAQGVPLAQNQSRPPSQPIGGGGGPNGEPPIPYSHQEAIAAAAKNWNGQQQQQQNATQAGGPPAPAATAATVTPADIDSKKQDRAMPISKTFTPTPPQPVSMPPSRPTLAGANNGPLGMMGQPAIQKPEPYLLQGPGDRVLDKKKLNELVRQVTGGGGGEGEGLHPEVEDSILQLADEFVENVVASACKLAKLRGSATLEVRDIQLILERQYNIRIPGYATDEVRTVRKVQPAAGYLQKMNAVQAAKVMNGRTDI